MLETTIVSVKGQKLHPTANFFVKNIYLIANLFVKKLHPIANLFVKKLHPMQIYLSKQHLLGSIIRKHATWKGPWLHSQQDLG